MKYISNIPFVHQKNLGRKRVLARKLAFQYEKLACDVFSDEFMKAAAELEEGSEVDFQGTKKDTTGEYEISIGGEGFVEFLAQAGSQEPFRLGDKALKYAYLSTSKRIRFIRFSRLEKENRHMNTLVGKITNSKLAT